MMIGSEVRRELREPPFTEPELIPIVYISGGAVVVGDNLMTFTGWTDMSGIPGGENERRMQVRFAMPVSAA